MRTRLLLLAALLTLAAVAVSDARATRFADTPCPESGPGRIRVCPPGVVGSGYTVKLAGDGGCGPALPYQYRVLNGTLPPGLSLSKDGEISGTPTSAGAWMFWIELSDQNPPSRSWCLPKTSEREFLINVGAPAATVGTPYSLTLGVDGGGTRTWSLVAGVLPSGMTLDPARGVIAGTPQEPGSFPLTLSAADSSGSASIMDFTLTVYPRLLFATTRLSPTRVGRPFRTKLETNGGVGPVKLRVVAGRFPIGVRLAGNRGVLMGRPRHAGSYRFTLRAQDSLGRAATRPFVLVVRRAS